MLNKLHAPKPKPVKEPKKKPSKQRVLVRWSDGHYEVVYRAGLNMLHVDKLWPVGTKQISVHQALIDILDSLCSDFVRRRDGYQCVLCGSHEQPQNGHVLVRGKWGTRWDLLNQHCQCSSCNIRHGKAQQAHYYYNWFMGRWGMGAWEYLCEKAESRRDNKSWTVLELQDLLEHYEALYEKLQGMASYDNYELVMSGFYGEKAKERYK